MPRNGTGTMERVHSWGDDRDAGINILADRVDADTDDIAAEITNSIPRDGQAAPTANLPMGGFRHTGAGNATARNQYAAAGQVQDGAFNVATAGGTADAIAFTLTPAITAYAQGQTFAFRATATNTGPATIAVSGQAAIAIEKLGAALVAGDITDGDIVQGIIRNISGTFTFQMVSPLRAPLGGSIPLESLGGFGEGDAGKGLRVNNAEDDWELTDSAVAEADDVLLRGQFAGFIPAAAFSPHPDQPSGMLQVHETSNVYTYPYMPFDDGVLSTAVALFVLPKSWDDGDVFLRVNWTRAAAGSGDVLWRVRARTRAADLSIIGVAGDQSHTFAAQAIPSTNVLARSAQSGALELVAGVQPVMQVLIDRLGNDEDDTFDDAARFLGVEVWITIDKGNDA